MDELLKKILDQDKTLLNRKDELISILDEKVPSRLARDYNSVKRALNLNIGEIFATGNSNREAAIAKATEILTQSGLQEARVKNVIDTFVKALSWDKEPVYEEPFTDEYEDDEEEEEIAPSQETEFLSQSTIETQSVKSTDSSPPKVKIPPSPQNDNPPPAQPPQQQQYQSPPPANNNGLKAIIVVLAVALFFALSGDDNKNSSKENKSSYAQEETQVEKSTEVQPDLKVVEKTPTPEPYLSAKSDLNTDTHIENKPEPKAETKTKTETKKPDPKQQEKKPDLDYFAEIACSDLSIGGVCIDDNISSVRRLLGTEKFVTIPKDIDRKIYHSNNLYNFEDVEVILNNDKVVYMKTLTSKLKTKRGIHAGSTRQQVLNAYGSDYSTFTKGDMFFYEYWITSPEGNRCLLRFAMRNDIVEYIGARIYVE